MICRSKRKAFSLLELLAVVIILGIIAAIVIPRVTTSTDTAKQSVNEFNKASMNSAIERYYINTGSFPAVLTDLVPAYLPDGIPLHPLGLTYSIDANNRVTES